MAARRRKDNPELRGLLVALRRAARRHEAPIWDAVAERLERPRHQIVPVNVGQLGRIAAAGDTLAVAGKLLADGRLDKRLTVGAAAFSAEAKGKIVAAGGAALTLRELIESRPDGSGVRLVA